MYSYIPNYKNYKYNLQGEVIKIGQSTTNVTKQPPQPVKDISTQKYASIDLNNNSNKFFQHNK